MINKTQFIILRVTSEMEDKVIKASKKAHKSVSKFVRDLIAENI